MRWILAIVYLFASSGFSTEYKIIKLDRKDIKLPEDVAYLLFDTPKIKDLKVDGVKLERKNGHFPTPKLPDKQIYNYKLEFINDENVSETRTLAVKAGDIALVISSDSILAQGARRGLFKKALRYERLTPRSDARGDSADVLVLNPPGTKVKIDGTTYGDKDMFAVVKLRSTQEEADTVIDIVKDEGEIVDSIKIPIKGGTRTLVGYSDLPVTLTRATKEPPLPTEELFLSPAKEK